MKAMKHYEAERAKLENKIQELKAANAKDNETMSQLTSSYKEKIGELNFDAAEKTKKQMKSVEDRIQERNEYITLLNPEDSEAIKNLAIKVAYGYTKEKEGLRKKADKVKLEIEAKKQEYIKSVQKLKEINKEHSEMRQQLCRLKDVTDWREVPGLGFFPREEMDIYRVNHPLININAHTIQVADLHTE